MNILVLKAEVTDCGTQICRMSTDLAEQLRFSFGSCILINTSRISVVCKLHHVTSCADQLYCLQYDTSVSIMHQRVGFPAQCLPLEKISQASFKDKIHLECLPCENGKEVCLKVVVKDIEKYCKWQTNDSLRSDLARRCFQCMRNFCVVPGAKVDLSYSRLGRLYGICYCIIEGSSSVKQGWKITEQTAIRVTGIESLDRYSILEAEFQSRNGQVLGGIEREKHILTDFICVPQQHKQIFAILRIHRARGILIQGPPGCGKTSLVRHIARECHAALLVVNGPEVIGSSPGESEANLTALFQKAIKLSEEGPTILLLDEIDSICPRRGKSVMSNSSRLTTALLSALDGIPVHSELVIVAATSRPSALDPAVRRPGRLDKEVLMSVPTHTQRLRILETLTNTFSLASDVDLDWLAGMTGGYVAADLSMMCSEAARHAILGNLERGVSFTKDDWQVTLPDFMTALRFVRPSMRKGVECVVDVQPVDWNDIGGLEDVKMKIKQAVEWPLLHPEAYQRMGLPVARGVLLYGPPGCGKTTLVQAAATASRVTFLSLSGAQLYSPFVGDSERMVIEAFQKARALAPSILFLDEVDAIVGKRSEAGHVRSVQERVLSTLLNEMDGVGTRQDEKINSLRTDCKELENSYNQPGLELSKEVRDNNRVLVVAATNRPDMVDDALLRPGRMDRLIYVPPPDEQARQKILEVHTKHMPICGVDLIQLATKMDLYTGADIENVCREAALYALTENINATCIRKIHFEKSLGVVSPSLTKEIEESYRKLKR